MSSEQRKSGSLKERWGLHSNWQLLAVLLVFSVNGSFATWVARPVTHFFGVSPETTKPYVLYLIFRILLIFPIYQLTLPLVGFIFGQFRFFWEFEKKTLRRLGLKRFFPEE